LASVLADIAEIASETLELQDVFDRVAAAIRELIPFDNMGVVRIVDGERAVLHASTVPCKGPECAEPIPLTSWSPRMRPRPGPNPIIRDAQIEFDPTFHFDSKALAGGVRSAMWEPFRSTATLRGGVWLAAYQPNAFTQEHQEVLRPIAALLGSAVEHWRIWDVERRRLIVSSGLRSWVRVPVWLSGEVRGGLSFFHREASRYGLDDAEIAIRLADRIGLMLSHKRLAEEARIAAESRERAERLEATVETLARELES